MKSDSVPLPPMPSVRRREAGYSMIEMLGVLAVAGVAVAFVAPRIMDAFRSVNVEHAAAEINEVIVAAVKYRGVNRDYASISMNELRTNGYGLSQFTNDGTAENTYGLDVAVASANSDADAEITYEFADEDACLQVGLRLGTNHLLSEVDTDDCDEDQPELTITVN